MINTQEDKRCAYSERGAIAVIEDEQWDVLCKLWNQYAPFHYQWPHDKPFEEWFREALPDVFRIYQAGIRSSHEVEQILGKALHYPWYKDDQKNFLGATERDGVCTADHTIETLAEEAAQKIAALEEAVAALIAVHVCG
mgnify:CR=1 FL=1